MKSYFTERHEVLSCRNSSCSENLVTVVTYYYNYTTNNYYLKVDNEIFTF